MKKNWLLLSFSLLLLSSYTFYGQSPVDMVGSGCALHFDGVDDYIDFNTSDEVFTPDTSALSISLWMRAPETATGTESLIGWYHCGALPTCGDGDRAQYKLYIQSGQLKWKVQDVLNVEHVITSSSVQIRDGQWHHVTASFSSADNYMQLYIDGILVSELINEPISTLPSNNDSIPLQIGREYVSWNNFLPRHYYEGEIDEIRMWDYVRTEEQIRESMCKSLIGDEAGLVGYWNFDDCDGVTLTDQTINGNDGDLMNDPSWVTSGAAIGEESTYLYPSDWSGESLSLQYPIGEDSLVVSGVTLNPAGIHVYAIHQQPNTLDSIAMIGDNDRYFGVFTSQLPGEANAGYSVNYYYENNPFNTPTVGDSLGLFSRAQNDSTLWTGIPGFNNTLEQRVSQYYEGYRNEYMLGYSPIICSVNLGEDLSICDTDSATLTVSEEWLFVEWPDASTSDSLVISFPNEYIVNVTDTLGCTTSDSLVLITNLTYDTFHTDSICEGDSLFIVDSYETSAGLYIDSLTTMLGCDSIVYTELSILLPSDTTLFASVCDSLVSPLGTILSSTGLYSEFNLLPNNVGCDSTISMDLTILESSESLFFVNNICDIYISPSGNDTLMSSGQYTEVIANTAGCDSVMTFNVFIEHSSESVFVDTTVCDAFITPSGVVLTNSVQSFVDIIPNAVGCDSTIIIDLSIVVTEDPTIIFTELACVRNEAYQLESVESDGVWSGIGVTDPENGIFDPSSTGLGNYEISFTTNGLCPATDVAQLTVVDCELLWQHIYVPNIFSPNGDDSNDEYLIFGDRVDEFLLIIYDRWGEKVFESVNISEGWDGNYLGEPMQPSTYAFILKGKYISGLAFSEAGYLTLIR